MSPFDKLTPERRLAVRSSLSHFVSYFQGACCFYRAEQLAIAQSTEERIMPKVLGGKLQRRGSLGGSLRRSKFKFTSQDKLDDQSFSEEISFSFSHFNACISRCVTLLPNSKSRASSRSF